jgi:hypothetical protein
MANQETYVSYKQRTDPKSREIQQQVNATIRYNAERMSEEQDREFEEARKTFEQLGLL